MTNAAVSAASTAALPALIVLGLDGGGKAHASWFGESETDLAEKAAGMMGMAALRASNDELRDLAGKLPKGKVFASGKAFVPFVKATMFDKIATHLPSSYKWPVRAAKPAGEKPKSGKKASAARDHQTTDPNEGLTIPEGWDKIVFGSLVLACENADEGWFPARVIQVSADGLFTLKWRDFPDWPVIVRRTHHLALLHPRHAE
ncbi:tudor domain-containing protein [Mesorhizobium sp. M0340]|uniref:tudor domain-containing protein n=1 Tax=Mesorhizobium sp. M0340 TaxID=2956939 RepID=UPI00333B9AC2